jgi:hypothetical protein
LSSPCIPSLILCITCLVPALYPFLSCIPCLGSAPQYILCAYSVHSFQVCITSTSILASLRCTCFVIARQILSTRCRHSGQTPHRPHWTLRPTDRNIYVLSTKTPYVQHQKQQSKMPETTTALYTRVPNIETWHRRLSHCNNQSIIDMARMGVTQGMPIDLSLLPANCDHCTIGKQSHSPVPKVREGIKSDKHLGRVHADVCGPMATNSCARYVYALNIIDDFSGYMWSVPL